MSSWFSDLFKKPESKIEVVQAGSTQVSFTPETNTNVALAIDTQSVTDALNTFTVTMTKYLRGAVGLVFMGAVAYFVLKRSKRK
jgi:hypothetical protein